MYNNTYEFSIRQTSQKSYEVDLDSDCGTDYLEYGVYWCDWVWAIVESMTTTKPPAAVLLFSTHFY
jgi:hypothetical protein